jgi:iron complex outermembrane recepter protein
METAGKPWSRLRLPFCLAANVAVASSSLCWPAQLLAQNTASGAEASKGEVLQEIVVTARKREENLQNIPVAITAITGDDMKLQSVTQLTDLQGTVPSLRLHESNDDPQSVELTIRGRTQRDIIPSEDGSVGVYVDGLYSPRSVGMRGSLLDIDRVEVLRGPQGTLYGRNTTSGAIAFYTKNPTDELSGSLDVTGGNYHAADVVGIANIPIADNLDARFVVQRGTHDGYGHSLVQDDLDSEDSQYYRGKLRWRMAEDWQALLQAHYESNNAGGALLHVVGLSPATATQPTGNYLNLETQAETGLNAAQSAALLQSYVAHQQSDFYSNDAISHSSSDTKRWDAGLTINGPLSDTLQFRSITGYQASDRHADVVSPVPAVSIAAPTLPAHDRYVSQEFQILGTVPRLNWVAGIYAGYETAEDDQTNFVLPLVIGLDPTNIFSPLNEGAQYIYDINSSLAAFAQATWEFIPDWHLTVGARYSHDSRHSDVSQLSGGFCQVPAPGVDFTDGTPATGASQCPRLFKNTFGKPSGLASLDYKVTPNNLLYAKVATGYRSGGENVGGGGSIASFAPFAPETDVEYELGIKSDLFDQKLRLNVAAYHDKYTNMQVNDTQAAANGEYVTLINNAAGATIEGFEAELDAIVAPGLRLHLSGAYVDAHYDKFFDARIGDRTNEPFPVPKWTYTVSGRYVLPTAFGEFTSEVEYNWQSANALAPTAGELVPGHPEFISLGIQPSYGLINARINAHVQAWDMDIALFGKNLAGKEYYDDMYTNINLGWSRGYVGAPRTYGVEVIKKFGK